MKEMKCMVFRPIDLDYDTELRLIKAAPELLDALKAAIALYGKFGAIVNDPNAPGEWISQARAAIAKAEGGTP